MLFDEVKKVSVIILYLAITTSMTIIPSEFEELVTLNPRDIREFFVELRLNPRLHFLVFIVHILLRKSVLCVSLILISYTQALGFASMFIHKNWG